MSIKITKVKKSKLGSVDFNNLPFGEICTDHMYVAEYADGVWKSEIIKPLTYFLTHPANLAWHYGQSIFEGMKASKHVDGTPMLFRVEQHARRMNASAKRMCMPDIPEEMFINAVSTIVKLEQAWIPPQEGSALYIRPFMFASDEFIGVRPSKTYKFVIFTCPVGPYYSNPVSLKAEDHYVRATPGGVGEAKTAGNYAASLYPAMLAKKAGFDQVMWMDPYEFKYVQEVGTMNIFFVVGKKVYTPSLNGAILRGITRDSIITILKDEGYKVIEGPVSIEKILKSYKKDKLKEVWGTGTAAVVSMVEKIAVGDHIITLKPKKYKIGPHLKQLIDGLRVGKVDDTRGWIQKLT